MSPIWRRPVVVLFAAMIFLFFTWGIRQSFGLLMRPITLDLGWGREALSLAFATQSLIVGLASPVLGAVADRYGAVRVLMGGGALYTVALVLMAHSTTPEAMFVSAGLLAGLGMGGAGMALVLAVVGRVAPEEKRSLWLGVATGAATAGQLVVVPIYQAVIEAEGWVSAVLVMAGMAALLVPLSATMAAAGRVALAHRSQQTLGQAVREAGGHGGFILLTLGFFVCGFQLQFIANHLPAYLSDQGLAGAQGALALALIGLFNMIGTWGAGALGMRYRKKYLLAYVYLGRSLIMVVFLTAPLTEASVLAFAAGVGLLWLSTLPLTAGLIAQVFGPRYMATLFGIVFLSHQVGSFMGVWLGGRLYDLTGSYDVSWWLAIAMGGFAALVHWPIDDRPVARLASAAPQG
jgi:MFS family permease